MLTTGQRVRCHLNLHRGDWSITVKGRVVAHVAEIALADVVFHVRARARERVVAKRCREVHAWAIGTIVDTVALPDMPRIPISYNPYKAATFVVRDSGEPIARCDYALFTANKAAFAVGEKE